MYAVLRRLMFKLVVEKTMKKTVVTAVTQTASSSSSRSKYRVVCVDLVLICSRVFFLLFFVVVCRLVLSNFVVAHRSMSANNNVFPGYQLSQPFVLSPFGVPSRGYSRTWQRSGSGF